MEYAMPKVWWNKGNWWEAVNINGPYPAKRRLIKCYCRNCGTDFYRRPERTSNFCSNACDGEYLTKQYGVVFSPWRVRLDKRTLSLYAQTYHPDYGWIAVHTLKMRLLRYGKEYVCHHKDGNPLNNSDTNLEALQQSEHVSFHKPRRWR